MQFSYFQPGAQEEVMQCKRLHTPACTSMLGPNQAGTVKCDPSPVCYWLGAKPSRWLIWEQKHLPSFYPLTLPNLPLAWPDLQS